MISQNSDCVKSKLEKITRLKKAGFILGMSYRLLGQEARAKKVEECGTFMHISEVQLPTGRVVARIDNANFCRLRLCPMCQWRRSAKLQGQMIQVMQSLGTKYRYILLTLTVPNCNGPELAQTVRHINQSFRRLYKMRFWSFSVKGYYSGLEVTHNVTANTYHPHMHVLLAVDTDYFSTQKYIDRDTWLRHWQSATRDPSITQVDVRAVDMGRTAEGFDTDIMLKSLLECCKYICKPAGLLDPSDMDMTAEVVDTVDRALKGVRLVSFGGAIADARKKLQLEDVEKGDLNSSNANQGEKLNEVAYCWHTGLSQYVPQE